MDLITTRALNRRLLPLIALDRLPGQTSLPYNFRGEAIEGVPPYSLHG
jgi:hypothetical protein